MPGDFTTSAGNSGTSHADTPYSEPKLPCPRPKLAANFAGVHAGWPNDRNFGPVGSLQTAIRGLDEVVSERETLAHRVLAIWPIVRKLWEALAQRAFSSVG